MEKDKECPKCGKAVLNKRKKFCSEHCKYYFNIIKKENESHLPPVKKRSKDFFKMVVGSERISSRGQGRRSGSMVKGSMSDMFIMCRVDEFVPVTKENIERHLKGIVGYYPNGIELCDTEGTWIKSEDIFKETGIQIVGINTPTNNC